MVINNIGGNSTVHDKSLMREFDPTKPIFIARDGRAQSNDPSLDRDESR